MSNEAYMKEWTAICKEYCKKVGAKLLFVNTRDFGCEMPNGELRHIDADHLVELLSVQQDKQREEKREEVC